MDQGLATVLQGLMTLVGTIISARAIISAAQIARQTQRNEKENHKVHDQVTKRPSKLTILLRVFPSFAATVMFVLAVVAVFIYIPFVSDYAFWLVVLAYIIMVGYRPASK